MIRFIGDPGEQETETARCIITPARLRFTFAGNHHGLLMWKASDGISDWQAVAAWFYGSMRPAPQCRVCGGECDQCEGSGMVDDPTACGDPDHCSPVAPCPHGCPELD